MSRQIYLASSRRNPSQPALVATPRGAGHEVYDFRNPAPGKHSFASDSNALDWRNTRVLLLPRGRSAHLEAGYAAGWCIAAILNPIATVSG